MFATVFFQMLALAIMILLGYYLSRSSQLDQHTMGQMSKLINYVFNPMMMLSSAINSRGAIDPNVLFQLLGLVLCMYGVLVLLSFVVAPLFDRTPGQKQMYQMMFIFGNVGFMGMPVVRGVFGEEMVVYVLAFVLSFNIWFYTFAVGLMDGKLTLDSVKHMLNPGTIFSIVTVLVVILQPEIPNFLATVVQYLGNVTSPMAMIAVGVTMANSNLKAIFTNPKMYLFTLVRTVLFPLACIPLLKLLPFDQTIIGVCLVEVSMPVANLPLMLGMEKGVDVSNCSASIIMTTLVSVLTIPLMVSLL